MSPVMRRFAGVKPGFVFRADGVPAGGATTAVRASTHEKPRIRVTGEGEVRNMWPYHVPSAEIAGRHGMTITEQQPAHSNGPFMGL